MSSASLSRCYIECIVVAGTQSQQSLCCILLDGTGYQADIVYEGLINLGKPLTVEDVYSKVKGGLGRLSPMMGRTSYIGRLLLAEYPTNIINPRHFTEPTFHKKASGLTV